MKCILYILFGEMSLDLLKYSGKLMFPNKCPPKFLLITIKVGSDAKF